MKSLKYQPDITIVIPAYSEARRIGKTLDELSQFLKRDRLFKSLETEILVVSADSTDQTHQIVLDKANKFNNLKLLKSGKKIGKGRDVQYGMLRAKGRAVIFMDADLATPLHHLNKFYETHESGADVVVGTRNLRKHHPSLARRILSNGGNILFRLAGGVWIEDSQCGFKLFSSEAVKVCFSNLTILGWGFDMEVLAIAKANNLSIVSYRINDWKSVENGTFTDTPITNAVNSLKELSKIFINRLAGHYTNKD